MTHKFEWRPRCWPNVTCREYWDEMLVAGAFSDRRSRGRLASIGLDLSCRSSANLLPPDPQWVKVDLAKAAAVARRISDWLTSYDLVYLTGGVVATAFKVKLPRMSDRYGWVVRSSLLPEGAVVIPHPSGLNRWWNDPTAATNLRRMLSVSGGRYA